jgi:transcriptional regulator with XRE-family HTH domain
MLREALAAAEMTQAELAKAMGITEKHVSKMLSGQSGAWAMYEYAAFTLGKRWAIALDDFGSNGAAQDARPTDSGEGTEHG